VSTIRSKRCAKSFADALVATSEQFEELLARFGDGSALVDAYFTFLMRLVGVVAAGYTVQALLRLRTEEHAGRVEPLLATAVSRTRWLLSHTTIALVGTVLVIAAGGVGAGLAYGVAIGDVAGGLSGPASAAVVQIPAALKHGAVVPRVFGVVPRWASAVAWGGLAIGFVVSQFGDVLELPQAVLNVSPFTHPPLVPAESLTWLPILVLLGTALVLAGTAAAAFRHRDLAV
jgi:ABC-2 type transport system permease protein